MSSPVTPPGASVELLKQAPPRDPINSGALLGVHLAEYSALTNRVTYFISLQYLTYSVAAVVLALVAQVWASPNVSRAVVAWGGVFLFLLLVWAWTYTVWEILNTAAYLEGDLRHRVERLVGDGAFWGWESYLAAQRKKGYDRFEWTLGLLILLIGGVVLFGRSISTVRDIFSGWRSNAGWILASAYVLVMITGRMRGVFRLQVQLKELGKRNQANT